MLWLSRPLQSKLDPQAQLLLESDGPRVRKNGQMGNLGPGNVCIANLAIYCNSLWLSPKLGTFGKHTGIPALYPGCYAAEGSSAGCDQLHRLVLKVATAVGNYPLGQSESDREVTWAGDVAAIFQEKCQEPSGGALRSF